MRLTRPAAAVLWCLAIVSPEPTLADLVLDPSQSSPKGDLMRHIEHPRSWKLPEYPGKSADCDDNKIFPPGQFPKPYEPCR
jgi:hypothetical protein